MNEKELGWKALLLAADRAMEAAELTRAEEIYKRALAAAEATFGENHTNVALNLMCLSECMEAQGNELQAKTLYKRVRQILAYHLSGNSGSTTTGGRNQPDAS